MAKRREKFNRWVNSKNNPNWKDLPLTHITGGVGASDILDDRRISPQQCKVLNEEVAYTFYGRAAYRVGLAGSINLEAYAPFCFVFDGKLLQKAHKAYPFDTGAYDARMYKPYITDTISYEDFSMSANSKTLNKLISTVFQKKENYFEADKREIPHNDEISNPDDIFARIYLSLIRSQGRNEPDDRVCSVEVVFREPLFIDEYLTAVIIPDSYWNVNYKSDSIAPLNDTGVVVRPYSFIPGKSPDHYHALIESELRTLFKEWDHYD